MEIFVYCSQYAALHVFGNRRLFCTSETQERDLGQAFASTNGDVMNLHTKSFAYLLLLWHVSLASDAAERFAAGSWESVERYHCDIEIEIPQLDGTPAEGRKYFLRKNIGMSGTGNFYHYLGHYHEGDSWRLEPRNQEVIITAGLRFHQWKFNRQFSYREMKIGDPLPGTLSGDTFFMVSPCWTLRDYEVPRDHRRGSETVFVLSEAIKSPDYVAADELSEINGFVCRQYAAIDGSDTIWLVADREPCLMRREFREAKTDVLLQRIDVQRIKEVQAGLSMPMEYQSLVFDPVRGDSVSPIRRAHFRVLDFSLDDDVPDDIFVVRIQPGSIQTTDDGFTQVAEGGEELFSELVTHLRDVDRIRPAIPKTPRLALAACFISGFLLVSTVSFHRRRLLNS
jgi:hypothetical protein